VRKCDHQSELLSLVVLVEDESSTTFNHLNAFHLCPCSWWMRTKTFLQHFNQIVSCSRPCVVLKTNELEAFWGGITRVGRRWVFHLFSLRRSTQPERVVQLRADVMVQVMMLQSLDPWAWMINKLNVALLSLHRKFRQIPYTRSFELIKRAWVPRLEACLQDDNVTINPWKKREKNH
jgi:hypothetical protein